jgi:hypothetical protein
LLTACVIILFNNETKGSHSGLPFRNHVMISSQKFDYAFSAAFSLIALGADTT